MKLKFELLKETNVGPQTLDERIHSILTKQNYIITHSVPNTAITFKDDEWEFRPMSDIDKKVDSGKFDIISLNGETKIKYTYYISLIPQLVMVAIIFFFAFVAVKNNLVLFMLPMVIIQLCIRINSLKKVSTNLIATILT